MALIHLLANLEQTFGVEYLTRLHGIRVYLNTIPLSQAEREIREIDRLELMRHLFAVGLISPLFKIAVEHAQKLEID